MTTLHKGPEYHELNDVECIILAGGLGTRLRSAVPDLPKCMAPVAGHPFLKYVIESMLRQGICKFIFSLGYLHEHIEAFLKEEFPGLTYIISLEEEPLGTGGAIQLASRKAKSSEVIVLNGDTLFDVKASALLNFHQQHHALCTLALKPMENFDRYGLVETDKDNQIISFREKQFYNKGLINGGVYALNVAQFLKMDFPEKFSFEKDFLEQYYHTEKMLGLRQDGYFIDIGIPEDFEKANRELRV